MTISRRPLRPANRATFLPLALLGSVLVTAAAASQSPLPASATAAHPGAAAGAAYLAFRAESLAADPANLLHERPVAHDTDEPLPVDRGALGLQQALRRLGTRASLLMIVAHPDDEDGGMLTYVSRGLGARVGILTLTRGEGGQNVVSGDFDDALGLVRTRELLAADRYLGVDQMFGTEADFGFSKTIEEAFRKWTHERVLYDAVRAVRLYRPLVIASVFLGAVTDGHGQHQVSGEIAQEAFTAAADPRVFPEMGLPPWQVRKVYARVPFATVDARGMYDYATGKYAPARFRNHVTGATTAATPQPNVIVPEGRTDALLGDLSYVQFAREGLALQRTQIGSGMRVPPAGRFDVGYTRYGSAPGTPVAEHEATFFDGIDTSLAGIASLAPSLPPREVELLLADLQRVSNAVANIGRQRSSGDTGALASGLIVGLRALDDAISRINGNGSLPGPERFNLLHELRVKRVQGNEAILLAVGAGLQAHVAEAAGSAAAAGLPGTQLVAGKSFTVEVAASATRALDRAPYCQLLARFAGPAVSLAELACVPEQAGGATAVRGHALTCRVHGSVPSNAAVTEPPFTRKNAEEPVYRVSDPRLRNAATAPAALTVRCTYPFGGELLEREQVVGNVIDAAYQPAMIVPPVSVLVSPAAGVVPLGERGFALKAHIRSLGSPRSGSLELALPGNWAAVPNPAPWRAEVGPEGAAVPLRLAPGQLSPKTSYTVGLSAESEAKRYSRGFETVGYRGLTRDNLFRPATYRASGVSIDVPPGLRVAYLPGTGDAVAASLGDIGIHPEVLSIADIAAGRLAGFDALLLGVRAYAAQRDLPSVTAQMLRFAHDGGAVVVQYNSAEYDSNYGPFPYSLTGAAEKVVEENAPVRLLNGTAAAQALAWPNRLSPEDFDGWVEERGHGFMSSWDSRYAALTEVHDGGQDPQRGGLLVATVGKGAYVYCAFALYRQMPAGVPGAFRLMANLLSLGRHPQ